MNKNRLCVSVALMTTLALTLPSYAQDIQVSKAGIEQVGEGEVVKLQLTSAIAKENISEMQIKGDY